MAQFPIRKRILGFFLAVKIRRGRQFEDFVFFDRTRTHSDQPRSFNLPGVATEHFDFVRLQLIARFCHSSR